MAEEENKKKNRGICFIMDKIINFDALILSGEVIFFLILGVVVIEKWLEICSGSYDTLVKAIMYSITIFIPLYLFTRGYNLIFKEKKEW